MHIAQPHRAVLGIDIGNVITGDTDKSVLFTDKYLEVPEIKGAFQSIKILYRYFSGRVYLVSKCREQVQNKTKHWLSHHGFYKATGVQEDNVFFCHKRHEKAPICERLGVTHFIDDRLEVLGYLKTVPYKYLFHPNQREVDRNRVHLPLVTRVESWQELLEVIVK